MPMTADALPQATPAAPEHPPLARALRILQVNSVLTAGGTDEMSVRTVEILRQLGQKVWMAGPSGSQFQERIGTSGLFSDPAWRSRKLRFAWHVAQCIRETKAQVVHGHHGRDYWPTILACWLSGTRPKIVLSRHLAKRPGAPGSNYFLLPCCDALLAVSEFVARVLREGVEEPDSPEEERRSRPPIHGDKSKIFVAQPGIETDRFYPTESSSLRPEWKLEGSHYVFAVVGVYDKPRGKGQRDFLLAASHVQHLIPQARFLIIGRGTLGETLKEDIARVGLTGKAWLTPYCSDMPQAMNAIDCLVHPAGGTEAFPLVISEALACGKPVIASRLDGIPETIIDPESATLFAPGSVEALGEQMVLWARKERWPMERRRELHQKVAAKLSLRAAGERLCQLYFKLVPAGEEDSGGL